MPTLDVIAIELAVVIGLLFIILIAMFVVMEQLGRMK